MTPEKALTELKREYENLDRVELSSLKPGKTALLVVDMVNGFAVEGTLASPRVGALIPVIAALARSCDAAGIKKIAFADRHPKGAGEFQTFPPHCVAGTKEAELVEELKEIGGFLLIPKNSTNGFLEEEFLRFIGSNPGIDTFIIAGDCTDLCILQLALTLKAHFNRLNLPSRIIVPWNAVDTYDAPGHSAELMNLMAFGNMRSNGIETVTEII